MHLPVALCSLQIQPFLEFARVHPHKPLAAPRRLTIATPRVVRSGADLRSAWHLLYQFVPWVLRGLPHTCMKLYRYIDIQPYTSKIFQTSKSLRNSMFFHTKFLGSSDFQCSIPTQLPPVFPDFWCPPPASPTPGVPLRCPVPGGAPVRRFWKSRKGGGAASPENSQWNSWQVVIKPPHDHWKLEKDGVFN